MKNMLVGIFGKSAILVIAIVLFTQIPAAAQEASQADELTSVSKSERESSAYRFWNSRNIEGTWNAQATIRICATGASIATFPAMSLFARGGTYQDTNATNPALRSEAFGTWEHLRGNKYRFAFKFFRFDASGTNIGSTIVRHTVVMDLNGNAWSSAGTAELYDAAGNLMTTGCSTATATRFN